MNMLALLQQLESLPGCEIYPPVDHALVIRRGLTLPSDVRQFYAICDGIDLFVNNDYPYSIV